MDDINHKHERIAVGAAPPATLALLLCCAAVPVIGIVAILPALPDLIPLLGSASNVVTPAQLVTGIPLLAMTLTAPLAGQIIDRIGRRNVLPGALILSAAAGVTPMLRGSAALLLVSRAVVGVAGAAILVTSIALICDHYTGRRRYSCFGLFALVAMIAGVIFSALSGRLSEVDHRAPFWLCGLPVLLSMFTTNLQAIAGPRRRRIRRFSPLPLRLISCLVLTIFCGAVFYTPVAAIGYVLGNHGLGSAGMLGVIAAINSVAAAIGTLVFHDVSAARISSRLIAGYACSAAGIAIVAFLGLGATAASGALAEAGLTIAAVGSGLLIPTMLAWSMNELQDDQYGRGAAWWTSSYFFGEFVAAMLVPTGSSESEGLFWRIFIVAVSCAVATILSAAVALRTRNATSRERARMATGGATRHQWVSG